MVSYDELSNLLGAYPDLIILRRFGPLASQVLLHLQAELLELDHDLNFLRAAEKTDPEQQAHAKSWAKANASIAQGKRSIRKELIEDAEKKLLRYCTSRRPPCLHLSHEFLASFADSLAKDQFVTHTSGVLKLPQPDRCDMDFLCTWLESERGGNNFLKKHSDAEARAWDPQQARDLMAVNKRRDRFAAWVGNTIMPLYHSKIGHRIHPRIDDGSIGPRYWYDDGHFAAVGNVICTVLSSVIPSISIVALYYIQNMLARLLVIIALSTLFSLIMSFVAQGRRYEVFAATTAFAAVQVVFVGGVNFVVGTQPQPA
ncbi:hypothetical protein AYO20_00705 [Fonsecaea nubica]|uniref:DUF6594 domain-containing protein n=1 Tax=Fonsecaea nubica TaxID=856822 RepID=A0A178DF02_9EURO|nr:hypothetical protein AYO20_00705 [Fonsecaea nubica]OAL39793.1 hypothetical protein AYO20_00705 [Fonsecaea nubica]